MKVNVVDGLVGHSAVVLSDGGESRGRRERHKTDLENVVVLESLGKSDALGDRECIREIYVWELVHLDGVVWVCKTWRVEKQRVAYLWE